MSCYFSLPKSWCRLKQESIPIGNHMCFTFSGHHQMSLPARSPNEHVWTGLPWSAPDITNRGGVTRSDVQGGVPYHVIYPMMYLILPTPPPHGQTDAIWSCGILSEEVNLGVPTQIGEGIKIFSECTVVLAVPLEIISKMWANHPQIPQVTCLICLF